MEETNPIALQGGSPWRSIGSRRSICQLVLQVTLEMLAPRAARGWGRVTALAAEHQISRTLLYAWRDRGQAALLAALAPQAPGPQPAATTVTVDAAFIQQAIAILATQRGTVRGIQQGLALLFQAPRSVGYISQTLTTLGAQAATHRMPPYGCPCRCWRKPTRSSRAASPV